MFPSQKYRAGQSSLEYLALAVFVMMGIIIGGPYVVRGINAHFKTLEEGALDSEREHIAQGVWGGADDPASLPKCDCTPLTDSGCGDGVIHDDTGATCSRRQKVFKRKCNVLGCNVDFGPSFHMTECRDDPDAICCDLPIDSVCGNADGPTGKCFSATGSQWYEQKMCGSPVAVMKEFCSYDVGCTYSCEPLDDPHAEWCNAAVQNINLISPDVPVLYRNPEGCTGDFKCEAQCIAPYVTDTRYNEDGKHCCGGGSGGIIINGGPYAAAMQSDSFDADGPDCIATPYDSKPITPAEEQIYQTINYVISHAGLPNPGHTNQNQTDVYAVAQADSYWSSVSPGNVVYAVIKLEEFAFIRFIVHDKLDPASTVRPTIQNKPAFSSYTGDGTGSTPYRGGSFPASAPVGFRIRPQSVGINYYSDPSLNPLGVDHMLSFQLSGLAGKTIFITDEFSGITSSVSLTPDTYLLAFDADSDQDYNDIIVLVTNIKPNP